MRNVSKIAPGWWDYTTLDPELLEDAAKLTISDVGRLSREGFTIRFYDTLEEFFLAEALEYIHTWQQSTADNPAGICGPIGPTEQLPLVARIVNDLGIDVRDGHFWAMDEWYMDGKEVPYTHPLSFQCIDMEYCFNRIDPSLRMPNSHLHFLTADNIAEYSKSYDEIECIIMQGGQGDVKHWAFNDPPQRVAGQAEPPSPDEYRRLASRIIQLHPLTLIQNARTSADGRVASIPSQAITVGPVETWKSKTVSIWHTGYHDNVFGLRLTALMISKRIMDSSVPMSLLADHPDVVFHYYRGAL